MKIPRFEEPRFCTVTFMPYPDGNERKPLKMSLCTGVEIGKLITVIYLARDGKEHRHKFKSRIVKQVILDRTAAYTNKKL